MGNDSRGLTRSETPSVDRHSPAPDLLGQVIQSRLPPVFIGTYSKVYVGEYSSHKVAIKVLRPIRSNRVTERKFRRELSIWWRLRHPNIVPLYGYLEHDDGIELSHALVSQWADGGSAAGCIHLNLTWGQRINLLRDVAKGLEYLHTFDDPVVHGDIKPLNVLIRKDGTAQLCDFGLARFMEYGPDSGMSTTTAHTGTVRYLAYELVEYSGTAVPTTATDVYALGCLAMEFIYKIAPHPTLNHPFRISWAIREGIPPAYRPLEPEVFVPEIWDLLEACWDVDPNRRPTASGIRHYLDKNIQALSTVLSQAHSQHTPSYDAEELPPLPYFTSTPPFASSFRSSSVAPPFLSFISYLPPPSWSFGLPSRFLEVQGAREMTL